MGKGRAQGDVFSPTQCLRISQAGAESQVSVGKWPELVSVVSVSVASLSRVRSPPVLIRVEGVSLSQAITSYYKRRVSVR